jgi:hypothetical protein
MRRWLGHPVVAARPLEAVGWNERQTHQCRSRRKTRASLVEAVARTDDPFDQVEFLESYRELQWQLQTNFPPRTCLSPAT